MIYQTESGKVNGLTIALILVGIATIVLFVVPAFTNGKETGRLEVEIDRVADETSIQPSSVECKNVEFASVCYANYAATTTSIKQMLTSSGYSMEGSKGERISAINRSTSIRIDSENGSALKGTTLKFKDINVTL